MKYRALNGLCYKFQSTPPAEARGDEKLERVYMRYRGFNPLPPPKRGETTSAHRHVRSR